MANSQQRLTFSGSVLLPAGDLFETAKRGEGVKAVLERITGEIKKDFPNFSGFSTTVAAHRENPGGRPRRNAAAGTPAAAAGNGAAGTPAAAGSAPAAGAPAAAAAAGQPAGAPAAR